MKEAPVRNLITGITVSLFVCWSSAAGAQDETPPAEAPPAETAPPPATAPAPAPAPATATTEAAPAAPAGDEGDRTHDGFFFRFGLNFGPLMAKFEPDPNPAGGSVKYSGLHVGSEFMFGGTPVKGLVIGGYLMGNRTTDPKAKSDPGGAEATLDGNAIFAGIGVFGNYYFDPKAGLHLQALLGFAALDFVSASGSSGGNDPSGAMLGLGVGYDFFFADEWSIGPFGRFIYAPLSADGVK